MKITDHIACLASDGDLLAAAAARAPADAPVPACPGWQVRDLLAHLGYVHRWAAGYVAEARTEPVAGPDEAEVLRQAPAGDALLGWFRDGHAHLVSVLRAADPAVRCWTFLAAPSPLAFWARRQAHETAIHRVDAQLAADPGRPPDPFGAGLALDGIDELVTGFGGRRPGRLSDTPAVLGIHACDGAATASWTVVMGQDGARAVPGWDGTAVKDGRCCQVSGTAADLYLTLWNRRPADGLDVRGDPGVLATWRDRLRVRWS